MLVKLTSSTSGEMIMFAEHARHLFEIIGKECTARGVFTKEQLPEAIARLHRAVEEEKKVLLEAEHKAREEGVKDDDEEKADEDHPSARTAVHPSQRAAPLIHLMEWTEKEKGFILWEADRDF